MVQIVSGASLGTLPTLFGVAKTGVSLITPTGEPARGYMWEVSITGPNNSATSGVQPNLLSSIEQNVINKIDSYLPSNSKRNDLTVASLNYYAKSISIPESSVETIQDDFMGEHFFHMGRDVSQRNATISFWDDQRLTIYGYLQTWIDEAHSAGSFVGRQLPKNKLLRDIMIDLKDTTNLFTILRVTLKGAMITNLNEVSLDYTTSEAVGITANFAFDYKVVGTATQEDS